MNSFDSRLIRDIGQRIATEIATRANRLHAQVSPDHAHYMSAVGFIKGLQQAMAIAAEVQQALSSPEGEEKFIRKSPENRTYEGL